MGSRNQGGLSDALARRKLISEVTYWIEYVSMAALKFALQPASFCDTDERHCDNSAHPVRNYCTANLAIFPCGLAASLPPLS